MRNKSVFLALAFVLVASICYGQAANPQYNLEGKTNFQYIGTQGSNTETNPGFIELKGTSTTSGTSYNYYLWVDETGDLRIASYAEISPYASFPSGNWGLGTFPVGTVVGGQS